MWWFRSLVAASREKLKLFRELEQNTVILGKIMPSVLWLGIGL